MGRKKKEVEVEEVVVGTDEQVIVIDSVLPVPEPDEIGGMVVQPGSINDEQVIDLAGNLSESIRDLEREKTEQLISELREQVAGLQRQFNHVPMLTPRQQEALNVAEEIGELTMFVIEAEAKFDKLDKEAKAAKKAFEAARDDMQAANERLHEITSGGDYQRRLFPTYPSTDFTTPAVVGQTVPAMPSEDVAVEQVVVDVGGSVSLDDFTKNGLSQHDPNHTKDGITAKKIEALKEEVGETVADLESWLQAGYALDSIKGFGPEWVTRTMDALGVIRDRYPVPEEAMQDEDAMKGLYLSDGQGNPDPNGKWISHTTQDEDVSDVEGVVASGINAVANSVETVVDSAEVAVTLDDELEDE